MILSGRADAFPLNNRRMFVRTYVDVLSRCAGQPRGGEPVAIAGEHHSRDGQEARGIARYACFHRAIVVVVFAPRCRTCLFDQE